MVLYSQLQYPPYLSLDLTHYWSLWQLMNLLNPWARRKLQLRLYYLTRLKLFFLLSVAFPKTILLSNHCIMVIKYTDAIYVSCLLGNIRVRYLAICSLLFSPNIVRSMQNFFHLWNYLYMMLNVNNMLCWTMFLDALAYTTRMWVKFYACIECYDLCDVTES